MFSQDTTLIGDVDCSGEINSQDASLILQFVTNVIDELPCEENMTGLTPEQLQEMIDMMEDQLSINYSAVSGGGCNFTFPDGLDGEPITINLLNSSYTVPTGKNLYVIQGFKGGSLANIMVDGEYAFNINSNNLDAKRGGAFIIKSGAIVEPDVTNSNTFLTLSGFLVDQIIDPITINLLNTSYTVPIGKKLYITNGFRDGSVANIILDGEYVFTVNDAHLRYFPTTPFIVESGGVLEPDETNSNSILTLSGYLADEDYFADCSGGGFSTTNSDLWSLINDTLNTDFNIRVNSSNFHIAGNNFTDFIISNDSVGDPSIWLRDVDSLITWRLHNDQSRGNIFSIRPWNNFSDFGGTTNIGLNNDPFSIDTLGRVSIGNGQLFKEKFNLFNNGSTFLNIESSSNNDAGIIISELSGARGARIVVDGDDLNNLIFQVTNDSGEYVDVLHMPFFPESEVGNVGIGIQNPSRKLHVNDVMRIEPRISPPNNPSKGDIYMDDIDNKLKVFDGFEWQSCF